MMKTTFLLLTVLFLAASCEKALFEKDQATKNPFENFEYLWNEIDQKYAYFELKGVDWNAGHDKYEARLYDGMTDDSLFNVLGAMMNELQDDHSNLMADFNRSFYGRKFDEADNFDWHIIVNHYIGNGYHRSGPFSHAFLDNGELGYVRFPSFSGEIYDYNFDYVLDRYKDTKGLILDLRENGGGSAGEVFELLDRFIEQETTLYYSRIKNGPGHNDFSEAEAAVIEPYDGPRYLKKVAVLTDRGTYSAGSFTALGTKAIPNMVLIGDTTGGGLGMPNGGQLPNGWTYRFSITQSLTLDKKPDYENGVPADIPVSFDWSDLTKDEILEAAIAELQ